MIEQTLLTALAQADAQARARMADAAGDLYDALDRIVRRFSDPLTGRPIASDRDFVFADWALRKARGDRGC